MPSRHKGPYQTSAQRGPWLRSRTSDGMITDLAIDVPGVTLKARKARVTWTGQDLTITLLDSLHEPSPVTGAS